jgi:hypothetical protein
MKITNKRHSTHKRLHKQDGELGRSKLNYNHTANKLLNDLSALLPKREGGFISSESDDIVMLQAPTVIETTEKITNYHLFREDEVLEDQIYIGLICEFLTENIELLNRTRAIDWSDDIITRDKQDFLREIGMMISQALNLEIDFIDYYSESLREYLGVREDLKDPANSDRPFNINLAMLFKLIHKGLIVLKEVDKGYISGEALLLKPYESRDTSFTNTCKKRNHVEKPLCIIECYLAKVKAFKEDITFEKSVRLVDTTKESLDKVNDNFYIKFGYRSIYSLIVSRL